MKNVYAGESEWVCGQESLDSGPNTFAVGVGCGAGSGWRELGRLTEEAGSDVTQTTRWHGNRNPVHQPRNDTTTKNIYTITDGIMGFKK